MVVIISGCLLQALVEIIPIKAAAAAKLFLMEFSFGFKGRLYA